MTVSLLLVVMHHCHHYSLVKSRLFSEHPLLQTKYRQCQLLEIKILTTAYGKNWRDASGPISTLEDWR